MSNVAGGGGRVNKRGLNWKGKKQSKQVEVIHKLGAQLGVGGRVPLKKSSPRNIIPKPQRAPSTTTTTNPNRFKK